MLREGAQRLIAEALQLEFEEFLSRFARQRDELGRCAVVRNGFQARREVLTGLGAVAVRVPKARSRVEEPAVFRSTLVPPYVRRAKSLDAVTSRHKSARGNRHIPAKAAVAEKRPEGLLSVGHFAADFGVRSGFFFGAGPTFGSR